MMSIANWIQKYKKSTNEDFFLPPNYTLMTNHEHGFVMYRVCGETMWVTQCCGHQWYWYPIMETIAKAFGCKQFKTFTSYSPKIFQKVFKGFKQTYEYSIDNVKYYIFTKEVE